MSNCDTCEHHTVEGRTTHYYGCKHGWESCRVCSDCLGSGVRDVISKCPICRGIGRVEVKG